MDVSVTGTESNRRLDDVRAEFRAQLNTLRAKEVWDNFGGRIALVLSGGGGRGAYQAGVLLAFQDAAVPTHIVAGSSIGSMNAAGYVGTSSTLVGNAEPVANAWATLEKPDLGIKWTRWAWMLIGLLAASAGIANLAWYAAQQRGIHLELAHPVITWFALACAGFAVLFTSDRLPYFGHLLASRLRGQPWQLDLRKAAVSVAGNLIFWFAIWLLLDSLLAEFNPVAFVSKYKREVAIVVVVLVAAVIFRKEWLPHVASFFRRVLALALHPGLFTNFDRARILRDGLTNEQLASSPIRLVITTVDMESGKPRFFCNAPLATLEQDAGADPIFIRREIVSTDDLIAAAVASSALPIAFEPMPMSGHKYGDGGLCANEPIRPAVALGADVVFVVMMSSPGYLTHHLDTFVDVGLSAIEVLMQQTLKHDLEMLSVANSVCEEAAAALAMRPEQVEIVFGSRRFRYVDWFAICPARPLAGSILECNPTIAAANMVSGYLDAEAQILNFLEEARESRHGRARRIVTWTAESVR